VNSLVSVIIPCFNSAPFIQQAVASLWAQTYQNLEIILVDDGSVDNTPALINDLLRVPSKCLIRTIHQNNSGVAVARNSGIAIATGEYILPLDADDLLHPLAIEACLTALKNKPTAQLVFFDRQDFGDSSLRWKAGSFELARLKFFNQLSYCVLYRRTLWQSIGGYRLNVSGFDDWDFWLAAALQNTQSCYLPEAYLLHRRHSHSQLWGLLPRYEELYSKIILNNGEAFTNAEKALAETFLITGESTSFLRASRFLFLGTYYPPSLKTEIHAHIDHWS